MHSSICLLQEVVVWPPKMAFALRPNVGVWEFIEINAESMAVGIAVITETNRTHLVLLEIRRNQRGDDGGRHGRHH
jgi:Sucrose synthase